MGVIRSIIFSKYHKGIVLIGDSSHCFRILQVFFSVCISPTQHYSLSFFCMVLQIKTKASPPFYGFKEVNANSSLRMNTHVSIIS